MNLFGLSDLELRLFPLKILFPRQLLYCELVHLQLYHRYSFLTAEK